MGSYKELMDKRGEFFKLVMLQSFEEQEDDAMSSDLTSIISESERGFDHILYFIFFTESCLTLPSSFGV